MVRLFSPRDVLLIWGFFDGSIARKIKGITDSIVGDTAGAAGDGAAGDSNNTLVSKSDGSIADEDPRDTDAVGRRAAA